RVRSPLRFGAGPDGFAARGCHRYPRHRLSAVAERTAESVVQRPVWLLRRGRNSRSLGRPGRFAVFVAGTAVRCGGPGGMIERTHSRTFRTDNSLARSADMDVAHT